MKRNWMQEIHDGLCIILNHLLLVAAGITILDLFQVNNLRLPLWVATVVIPFFVYRLLRRTPKLIPPPIFIILLGILSLAEKIMTTYDRGIYYYVITFAYFIGYFIYYFTKQFLQFLTLNQNTASNIPTSDIFRNGIVLTLLFSVCSSVILFMSANFDWMKVFADQIWKGILAILGYIFGGIDTKPPIDYKEEFTQEDPQIGGGANMAEVIPEQTLETIRNVIIVITIMAIVIGFILFLYFVYYVIKGRDKALIGKKQKESLEENADIREYCGIERKSQRKAGGFLFRNNREKVRRLYQKKVLKRKAELIGEQEEKQLKYFTAKECCDRLTEQQLKLVYEKARYSEEMITAEEVKRAK